MGGWAKPPHHTTHNKLSDSLDHFKDKPYPPRYLWPNAVRRGLQQPPSEVLEGVAEVHHDAPRDEGHVHPHL